jgi:hypothetical protein
MFALSKAMVSRFEVKVSTEPAATRSALESYADRLERVRVEASSLGVWLYRETTASWASDHCRRRASHARVTLDDAQ